MQEQIPLFFSEIFLLQLKKKLFQCREKWQHIVSLYNYPMHIIRLNKKKNNKKNQKTPTMSCHDSHGHAGISPHNAVFTLH